MELQLEMDFQWGAPRGAETVWHPSRVPALEIHVPGAARPGACPWLIAVVPSGHDNVNVHIARHF
jgi:hypothetical protein